MSKSLKEVLVSSLLMIGAFALYLKAFLFCIDKMGEVTTGSRKLVSCTGVT